MSETPPKAGKCPVTGLGGEPEPSAAEAPDAARPAAAPNPARKRQPRKTAPEAALLPGRAGLFTLVRLARGNVLNVIPQPSLRLGMVSGKLLRRFHVVTSPEGNRRILKTNIANYPKSPEFKGVLEKALKQGLFVIEGEEWRWQRRAMNPAFAPRNVARLTPPMTRSAEEAAERLAGQPGPVNISYEMMKTAFDVIVRVTFAGGDGESAVPLDTVSTAIDHYLGDTGRVSAFDYLGLPTWIPRPGRVRTHPTLKALKDGADAAIAERRRKPNTESPALLDLLLDAEDPETGRKMNDVELRDNLITFLIAGHETTAIALSWALYLLAFEPATHKRAAREAREVLGKRAATGEDVPRLVYIRQVLQEAMRLYPPIPVHLRTAEADDTVAGTEIRKGDTMILPFYALHRHKLLWDRPRQFRPERFDDPSKIDRYAYMPFSAGPRVCIGAEFAMQESIIILATLLARFDFALTDRPAPKPKLILTLRPDRDIWLNVTPARRGKGGKPRA